MGVDETKYCVMNMMSCVMNRDAKKTVFLKPCFLCKKKSVFYRKKQFFNVFFVFFQLQEDL